MPRPRRLRKIVAPPKFKGYKPYGTLESTNEVMELLYEEYEALKLTDYDLLHHQEASSLMGVSRATFARIYESARRKIANALVEAKEIITVYGNTFIDDNWWFCQDCDTRFSIPIDITDHSCPLCKSTHVKPTNN